MKGEMVQFERWKFDLHTANGDGKGEKVKTINYVIQINELLDWLQKVKR